MAEFPTAFTDEVQVLDPDMLVEPGREALIRLQDKGFEVVAGLRRADMSQITEIASQWGVKEFCPKDATKRFPDPEITERDWLSKGRGPLQLRDTRQNIGRLAGYGWTGWEPCEQLPDHPVTFAERINEEYAGRGLAAPFASVIVAGNMALYGVGAERVGLETWGSNTAAVRAYVRAGAELVTTADSYRPTQIEADQDENGERRDVRLYMKFPYSEVEVA